VRLRTLEPRVSLSRAPVGLVAVPARRWVFRLPVRQMSSGLAQHHWLIKGRQRLGDATRSRLTAGENVVFIPKSAARVMRTAVVAAVEPHLMPLSFTLGDAPTNIYAVVDVSLNVD
jgi:hypothetical protein